MNCNKIIVFLAWTLFQVINGDLMSDKATGRRRRQSPFGGMGGGGPFHNGMGGPMSGMSPMPGGPSGMGPSMGGQTHSGAAAMFNPAGLQCIRHNIVCPKWCLIEDENGCNTCPCGPAGGMGALGGGPSGGPMSAVMSMASGGHSGGFPGGGGGSVTSTGTSSSVTSGSSSGEGGGVSSSSSASSSASSSSSVSASYSVTSGSSTQAQTYVTVKPVKECAATLLCASTCESGYRLETASSGGCRSCTCPNSHQVSTSTIQYIVQTVSPAEKECTHTAHCMGNCPAGYVMSETDGYGCPKCACLKVEVERPHVYPIEIAVEPPPDNGLQTYTQTFTCAVRSCNSGCSVGYRCGTDGCPSCECIHPSVVGLTTVQQVYIERPLTCRNSLSCPSSCKLGYKCGPDGCPTCECLVAVSSYVQTRPEYTAQTCTHTLTCAATCTNGYELFSDGTSSCSKCACRQQVVYNVQRPAPQYQIVQCPRTDGCASTCPHGYTIVTSDNGCPQCKCKPAPVYYTVTSTNTGCTSNCETSSNVAYYTKSSVSQGEGGSYTTYSGGSGLGYILTGGGVSQGGGSSYVVTSGTDSYRSAGGGSYSGGGLETCPPLPPDCDPLCIKYDEPHCRRCTCYSSYFRFSQG